MTHLLSYIAVAVGASTLSVLVMACLCAGSDADDASEAYALRAGMARR